ncbi:MAG: ABC transporter substrate-binding protein [Eubacterium sp.]
MKKLNKILAVILAAVLVFSFAACSKTDDSTNTDNTEKTKITVCLDWTPNTNHTGMYVALEKGYYDEAGLDVSIVQPPENTGAAQVCASGQAQFAVEAQDTLAASFTSDTPLGLTAVAALIQHNTSGIISKAGQGMDSPKGLAGNTYLTWDSPIELAMMEYVVNADGANWEDVTLIPNTVTDEAQDVNANPDHAIWVFAGWGGINAKVNNIDTDFFYFKDIDETFDYYTPVLIANNDFLASSPDVAKAFLEATGKGYEYAIENPEDAADILIQSDETGSLVGCEELVIESQKWLADQYIADASQWGYIDPQRWDGFYAWLWDNQLIEKELPAGTGFSNDYLS